MSSTARWFDRLAHLLAVLFALPTLYYPHGRDQALFAYIGWGWLDGHLPYVDSFDQKPPGIYLVYALTWLVLGPQSWGIRALEIGALALLGRTLARVAAPQSPIPLGGLAALLMTGIHFTYWDFWHTGQLEIWEALFLALAMEQAGRQRPTAAGFLAGMAFIFKFPALPGMVVVAAFALWNRRQLSTFGLFLLGSLVPALVLTPWALRGALDVVYQVLIVYNRAYLLKESAKLKASELWLGWAWPYTVALGALVAGGLVASLTRRDLGRGPWLLALLGAVTLSVYWQDKLYPYHWTVVPPFAIGLALWGLGRVLEKVPETPTMAWLPLVLGLCLVLGGAATAPGWYHNRAWSYRRYVPVAVQHFQGKRSEMKLLSVFKSTHAGGFDAAILRRTADVVNAHKKPGDTLCMLGFDAELNNGTGLRCTSRFFADFPVADKKLRYPMKKAWTAEHEGALRSRPPTFAVLPTKKSAKIATLLKAGYTEVGRSGRYVVLERRTPTPSK